MRDIWYAVPSIILVSAANATLKWTLSRYPVNLKGFERVAVAIFDPYFVIAALATGISIIWWLSIINKVKVSIVYPVIQAGAIALTVILCSVFLGEKLLFAQYIGLLVITLGICILASSGF
tara:strand:+ start:287 stop:649 length:363 start_codon:yes stop_codon:yes gene_type:complete